MTIKKSLNIKAVEKAIAKKSKHRGALAVYRSDCTQPEREI
jgi:hypothetical protein